MINYFLNQRVPILEEYAPEKLICYLYHKTGKKIVTAKEAIELAENQLHGLQVTSVHMAIAFSIETYSISAINIGGELNTEIFIGKFGKDANQIVRDTAIIEKFINLLVYINDTIVKISKRQVQEIHIDLLYDTSGYTQIIKIDKLLLKTENIRPSFIRKSSIKLIQFDDSSDESIEDEIAPFHSKGAINYILEKEKKNHAIKVPITKPYVENSSYFLQMIANTFDRDRKKYERKDIGKDVRNSAPLPENPRFSGFLTTSIKTFRESRSLKKSLNSLSDLISYVEKTRPKI